MINLKKYSWSGSWVARKPTRNHTSGGFSSDDEHTEDGRMDLEVEGDFWTKLWKFMWLGLPIAA